MRKLVKVLVCLSFMALTIPQDASAQRTAYGEKQLSVSANWTISSLGAEAYYGEYLLYGYWFAGANFNDRFELDGPSQENIHFPRMQAFGGYMGRLYGSRSRSFNLYAGGDVFLGMEVLDMYKTLTAPTMKALLENGLSETRFIYGVALRLESEAFLSPALAVTPRIRIPFCLGTNMSVMDAYTLFEIGVGLKYNF